MSMRSESSYIPHPIDTSDVILEPEILALAERLAENTHDVYVQGRLAEGWTLGPRDDIAKPILLSSPMSNCQRVKRSTTVVPVWKP